MSGKILSIPMIGMETDEMYKDRVEYIYENLSEKDTSELIGLSKMFLYKKYFGCEFKEMDTV